MFSIINHFKKMYFFYIICFIFNYCYLIESASLILFVPFYLLLFLISTRVTLTLYKKKRTLLLVAFEQIIFAFSKMKIWHAFRRLYFYNAFLKLYKFLLILFEHCLSLFQNYKNHILSQHLITIENFVNARYELLLYVSKNL